MKAIRYQTMYSNIFHNINYSKKLSFNWQNFTIIKFNKISFELDKKNIFTSYSNPKLTPQKMLKMGVFGGSYFSGK